MNEPGCTDQRCSNSPSRSGEYVQKQIIQDKRSLNYSCTVALNKALMHKKKINVKKNASYAIRTRAGVPMTVVMFIT